MAQKDHAQGFGFMYADIAKLMKKKNDLNNDGAIPPVSTAEVKIANFNRDPRPQSKAPETKSPVSPLIQERTQAIGQIKENLDRLQSLHHKLHAMLEELNKLSDKKR